MTEAEYRAARAAALAGEDPPQALLDDCRRTIALLAHNSGLPAHYSPYGVWSGEAIDEVNADWIAVRLVGRGQLRAILQRAPVLRVFRRMVETSVRQHLIDRLNRSQAANLFDRVSRLLAVNERFTSSGSGTGRLWQVAGGPATTFDGDDRRLLGVAWSLGDFHVIRYNAEARKLSHLLEADDLERFVVGMLGAGTMTTGTIVRALRLRFGLSEEEPPGELDEVLPAASADPQVAPIVAELATATLAELTKRQARVLLGLSQDMSGAELAQELNCSTGTISHERRRLEDILARLGADAPEVLKHVLDALFQDDV
jgi:DNA-binding CsgD family transcriptional regulator